MATDGSDSGLQLRSLVKKDGVLEISLLRVPTPEPAADEVVVRVDAAPINPSDLGLLFGAADMSTAKVTGAGADTVVTATVPEKAMRAMSARIDVSMPVGNEGAGVVVRAGASDAASALMGKTVAVLGGAMFSQYRTVKVQQCLVLLEGTTAKDGASCFVNPLTALGMVETMKLEGHKALVHTAAASNLGLMLNRLCIADKVPLVNIVRKEEQAAALRTLGAAHICNSSSPSFMEELTEALAITGATLAFDAIGGGKIAGQILTCMEAAINKTAKGYSRYGSSTHKQVYIYGALDMGPTELSRSFGLAWGVGGWLVSPFTQKIGPAATMKLQERIARELKTIFASAYSGEGSLAETLSMEAMNSYGRRATGEKYLVVPSKDA